VAVTTTLAQTTSAAFGAQPTAAAGALGPWFTSLVVKPAVRQDSSSTIAYGGTWSKATSSAAFGGTLRYASAAGRTAATTATGSSFAWVSTLGKNRGMAQVFVDGVKVATISLYASASSGRRIVWSTRFATAGSHTVKIKVLGTHAAGATGNQVDFDAFLILGN